MLLFAPGLAGGLGIDHRCDRVRLPCRTHQEKNFIRVNSRDSRPTSLEVVPSPQAAIALPLDRGHFVGGDIYLERAIFADASLFAFKRNPAMAWRERHAKPSITVRRKFGCDGIRLGLHNKRRIGERFRGRLVYPNWPRCHGLTEIRPSTPDCGSAGICIGRKTDDIARSSKATLA